MTSALLPREKGRALLVIASLALPLPALAEPIHGRIELSETGSFARDGSLDAAFGSTKRSDALADLRLTWEPASGPWSAQVHYEATLQYGDSLPLARAQAGPSSPGPPTTWLDLDGALADRGRVRLTHRIDRLNLAWSSPSWVVRVGRQALTWGGGLAFRPMDLFNPFGPGAVDTEFKPGADMLYVQRLFAGGSDLQAIVVPRATRFGRAPTADASSFALHYRATLAGRQTTWMIARDHGDWVGAAGLSGALGGATWNLEVVPTGLRTGGVRVSAVANITTAVTISGHNATVFAEYYRNGFGVGGARADLADLPPDLADRLVRGQVFGTRRDYLAAGMTFEATPLLTLSPTIIADLDGPSAFLLAQASYSLGNNLTVVAGAQVPVGVRGSDYGGLPLSRTSPTLAAPPARLYIQLRRYF